MKLAGQLMLPDGDRTVRLSPGVVEVEQGRITAITEGDIPDDADLGGQDRIICPGFIDAHVHLPQFDIIGAHGLELLDWLSRVTFPAERAWADTELARAQAERAMRRMLAAGTTGFAAYATVHHDATRTALDAAKALGVRAWIGQVLMDRNAPPELCRPAGALLDETAALLEAYPAQRNGENNRVCAAVTPRFAPTCSAELLRGAGQLAHQHNCMVQTHLAETRAECDWVGELFGKDRYLEVYREAGLLGERSVFGHGIYTNADDRRAIRAVGARVAHCPTANRFLMSGRLDWSLLDTQELALGSDIGAGYEVAMPRVARAMLETASELRIDDAERGADTLPSAAHAWWQITAGNAAALHWPDGGKLEVGAAADLLLLRPTISWQSNAVHDPLSLLLWGWQDGWVERVMLRAGV